MATWTSMRNMVAPNLKQHRIHRVTQIKFKGFDTKVVGSARRARLTLDLLNVPCSGPVPLPRRRRTFNFLKSPFKWKKHQELWEMREYSRVITFEADLKQTNIILKVLYRGLYDGVGLRVRRLEFEPIEKYIKDPYYYVAELGRDEELKAWRRSAALKKDTSGRGRVQLTSDASHKTMDDDGNIVTQKVFNPHKEKADLTEHPDVLDYDIVYDDDDYRLLDKSPPAVEKAALRLKERRAALIKEAYEGKISLVKELERPGQIDLTAKAKVAEE
eukprot:TRINITY_DN5682_c0_g1_i1.p1 TRINITY_DN5682_c0_g1~~TRINITY_DN5682_c0_g1_i1.p1  ORF type:complete len:292 (+),score=78.65 TRINITY_DN5682_c0_g1_i1:58-876(+)